jgi:predicted Zn-ribbon and HTH transcriptional regulator
MIAIFALERLEDLKMAEAKWICNGIEKGMWIFSCSECGYEKAVMHTEPSRNRRCPRCKKTIGY